VVAVKWPVGGGWAKEATWSDEQEQDPKKKTIYFQSKAYHTCTELLKYNYEILLFAGKQKRRPSATLTCFCFIK